MLQSSVLKHVIPACSRLRIVLKVIPVVREVLGNAPGSRKDRGVAVGSDPPASTRMHFL